MALMYSEIEKAVNEALRYAEGSVVKHMLSMANFEIVKKTLCDL